MKSLDERIPLSWLARLALLQGGIARDSTAGSGSTNPLPPLNQQPIPSRGSTKPRRATKPSKIRDVPIGKIALCPSKDNSGQPTARERGNNTRRSERRER
jgi:hypothetical protein